jgi:hypothetical protein
MHNRACIRTESLLFGRGLLLGSLFIARNRAVTGAIDTLVPLWCVCGSTLVSPLLHLTRDAFRFADFKAAFSEDVSYLY